jgi:NAD(P)H-nitrite reductase large subunit
VIVGSGVTGLAAAEAIRQQDADGSITMISDDPFGYYSRPGLAYLITDEINESSLYPFKDKEFKGLGINRIMDVVTRVDIAAHTIQLARHAVLHYDRLLMATGSVASRPSLPGMELDGVLKLDNLADARAILQRSGRGRSAVVIGGGITAIEIVEGLVSHGARTHYFLRGDRYWSNVLDETESAIVEHRLVAKGVRIHKNTEALELSGEKGKLRRVCTADGRQIPADLVAFAIGISPRTELARDAGLKVDRGILVDEGMRTNIADVFAAGDVAQVRDPVSGKYILDSLWGPARDQGKTAGANMAGGDQVYRKPIAFNVTRLSGLTTTIIGSVGHGRDGDLVGIARGDSEAWRLLPEAMVAQNDTQVNHLRLLIGPNAIIGAVLMGDQTLSRPLGQLVEQRVDISAIRDQLLQGGEPLGRLVLDRWAQWRKDHA